MEFETFLILVTCGVITISLLFLAQAAISLAMAIVALVTIFALAIFSASPLFYEYPNLFENNSTVLEYTDTGYFVEHPHGAFCFEGDDNFVTVSTPITIPAIDEQIPVRLHSKTNGFVVVKDYTKLMRVEDLQLNTAWVLEITSVIKDYVQKHFEEISIDSPKLLEYLNHKNPSLRQQAHMILERRMNQWLTKQGLLFSIHDIT